MISPKEMNEITAKAIRKMNDEKRARVEQWLLEDRVEENLIDAARNGMYGKVVYAGSLPNNYIYAACEYFDSLGYYVESKDNYISIDWGEMAALEEEYY